MLHEMGQPMGQPMGQQAFQQFEAVPRNDHHAATDMFDFKLDDMTWKSVFSKPGGVLGGFGCCSSNAYFAARCCIFGIWLGAVVHSFISALQTGDAIYHWFTYLTHWSAIIELAYFGFATYSTYESIYGNVPDGSGDATPWFVSATWLLSTNTVVMSFLVTAMYWVLVYKPETDKIDGGTVMMHGWSFVLALVVLLLTRQPYYIQHVFVPFIFAVVYASVSIVYYLAGGVAQNGVSRYMYEVASHKTGCRATCTSPLIGANRKPPASSSVCSYFWPSRCSMPSRA